MMHGSKVVSNRRRLRVTLATSGRNLTPHFVPRSQAGTPEKNYYEFARRVVGILDADLEFHGWLDVETEDPGSIRYGVNKIYQARVVRETDSEKQPASPADGAFVLIYRRDPDLKFCARRYRFEREPSGERKITYTDFEDGREYSFRMTKNWPRPFAISVIEVLPGNLLHDVWHRFHQKYTGIRRAS